MFQFPELASPQLCIDCRMAGSPCAGFPIRRSPDRSLFTTPRSFSQCPTSFIGIWRLGIHHKLLVASSRDAENSVLLLLHYYYNLSLSVRPTSLSMHLLRCEARSCWAFPSGFPVGRRFDGDGQLRPSSRDHPSPSNHSVVNSASRDKPARLTAGPS